MRLLLSLKCENPFQAVKYVCTIYFIKIISNYVCVSTSFRLVFPPFYVLLVPEVEVERKDDDDASVGNRDAIDDVCDVIFDIFCKEFCNDD